MLRWRETRPAAWYRDYEIGVGSDHGWNFDWMRRSSGVFGFVTATLTNYWETFIEYGINHGGMSDRLTRGGPLMANPNSYFTSLEVESREGARNRWSFDLEAGADENGGFSRGIELSMSVRPGSQLELSFDPSWERGRDTRQYIATEPGGRAATFGNRYVFAAVDLSEISGRLRANYTFTPDLSLETYAEPFAASGRFHSFGELRAPRAGDLVMYGSGGSDIVRNPDGSHTVTDANGSFEIEPQDFNVRSFRSNVVLRWEWRPGSTMFVVWQQDRSGERVFRHARPGDLFDALNTRGDNIFAVKLSYWLALD
jgi:hypothetical protein